jgi:hypothetical protein
MAMLFRHPIALARPAMHMGLRAGFATMPTEKPDPHFSSGPCKKRPGWSTDVYKTGMRTRRVHNQCISHHQPA